MSRNFLLDDFPDSRISYLIMNRGKIAELEWVEISAPCYLSTDYVPDIIEKMEGDSW